MIKLADWSVYTAEGRKAAIARAKQLATTAETGGELTSDERAELCAIHDLPEDDPRRVAFLAQQERLTAIPEPRRDTPAGKLRDACEACAHKLGELATDEDVMEAIRRASPELHAEIEQYVQEWRDAGDAFLRSLVPSVKV